MHKLTRNVFLAVLMTLTATMTFGRDNPTPPPIPVAPAAPPTLGAPAVSAAGPKIEFSTPVYDFGRIQAGELVKHTFMFTNNGDQPLELSNVQPSCGCTTAGEWSRKVMNGQTGLVPIQFNSSHFNGDVFKTISVSSNDRQKPVVVLQLKGKIWKPLELVPPYTVVNVVPDASSASAVVRILNNTEEPLTLSTPEISTKSFNAMLTTVKPGKEFQLSLASVGELNSGSIQGKVLFKTSWTNNPTLEVPFWVNVQPALSIIPPHIMLPRAPFNAKAPAAVTIQNNSTNALTLSDPVVNVPGVGVEIKEVQPGKMYRALLTFPEGFEIPAGQQAMLTMKSSIARMPEIRVPVSQTPRPVVVPPPVPQPQQPANLTVAKPAGQIAH
jgi:hypothetical protein